ncbi:hypothetical protein QBC40DRAFT_271708 [Triangularia verruculosa]|uniref:Uncharacterized protein n=1 Tax=Triangularia verruculosa TaxID=2587418 RepID=A0AAN6XV19_9PEZI|nr:hypothetical protein QBC40DRAFT_271708 [Triangularia verruculosa]
MKSIISLITVFAGLTTATPVPAPQTDTTAAGPYHISGFFASKAHLSSYCRFEFNITGPTLSGPVSCSAYLDTGFSGATWLAYVYQGVGNCNSDAVTWTFWHPRGAETDRNDAVFNVTVDGVKGTYVVPKEDIFVNLNDEGNPFDNDVSYAGPREFDITDFPVEE